MVEVSKDCGLRSKNGAYVDGPLTCGPLSVGGTGPTLSGRSVERCKEVRRIQRWLLWWRWRLVLVLWLGLFS